MLRVNEAKLKLITNKVEINIQVLGALMKNGISNNMEGYLIITPNRYRNRNIDIKITKYIISIRAHTQWKQGFDIQLHPRSEKLWPAS